MRSKRTNNSTPQILAKAIASSYYEYYKTGDRGVITRLTVSDPVSKHDLHRSPHEISPREMDVHLRFRISFPAQVNCVQKTIIATCRHPIYNGPHIQYRSYNGSAVDRSTRPTEAKSSVWIGGKRRDNCNRQTHTTRRW